MLFLLRRTPIAFIILLASMALSPLFEWINMFRPNVLVLMVLFLIVSMGLSSLLPILRDRKRCRRAAAWEAQPDVVAGVDNALVVEFLQDNGAGRGLENLANMSALLVAAREGRTDLLNVFLLYGADINSRDWAGRTPLMLAAQYGQIHAAKLLLERGADINAADPYGRSAVSCAAKGKHREVVELLTSHGADMPPSPVVMATAVDKETTQRVIEDGDDINERDSVGRTNLIRALERGDGEVVCRLLRAGVDVRAKDNFGRTALMVAAKEGPADVVKLLLEAVADANAKDINGESALQRAKNRGHKDIVKLLKAHGARELI